MPAGSVTRVIAMSETSRRMTCRVALEYFEADHDNAARGEGVVVGWRVNNNRWCFRCGHWSQGQQSKGHAHCDEGRQRFPREENSAPYEARCSIHVKNGYIVQV
jgi:hypothetical protein